MVGKEFYQWLNDAKSGWQWIRLKYLASVVMGQSPLSDDCNIEGLGFPFLQGNADFGKISPSANVFCEKPNKTCSKDSVLLSVRAPVGARNLADQVYAIGRGLCAIKVGQKVFQQFLWYLLDVTKPELEVNSTGTTFDAISVSDVENLMTLLPPLETQWAIAAFLDYKTGLIDQLIEEKEKLVQLLEEKRIALITQAVTKGLDLSVPMKPSGIEWLGDIPAHWEVVRLKRLLKTKKDAIKTGPFGSQLLSSETVGGEVKVYNQRNVLDNNFSTGDDLISIAKYEELKAFETFPGDILITTRGTIGRCAILPKDAERGILHPCLMRIQVKSVIDSIYLLALFQYSDLLQKQILLFSNATTIPVLYSDTLKELTIPLPSFAEQIKILSYITSELLKIQDLESKMMNSIQKLKEYKESLIYSVVTGKINVSDFTQGTPYEKAH